MNNSHSGKYTSHQSVLKHYKPLAYRVANESISGYDKHTSVIGPTPDHNSACGLAVKMITIWELNYLAAPDTLY